MFSILEVIYLTVFCVVYNDVARGTAVISMTSFTRNAAQERRRRKSQETSKLDAATSRSGSGLGLRSELSLRSGLGLKSGLWLGLISGLWLGFSLGLELGLI